MYQLEMMTYGSQTWWALATWRMPMLPPMAMQ